MSSIVDSAHLNKVLPTPFPPSLIDTAYTWLCTRREDYHCHDDVWFLRFYWQREREQLLHELAQESFCFSGVEEINTASGSVRLWSARDALVLKALTLHLQELLAPVLSARVFHLAGTEERKRGAKAAVREVYEHLAENVFVFRTDVKGYYASIHHAILLRLLGEQVRDPFLLRLLDDFLHHTVYCDGLYRSVGRGISLGCALSPLMGALYLKPLDDAMARTGLFYCRFMDDWVILSPTQARFRRAVATVNRVLHDLKVEKHPDKTFIGRISRGFDFLGYQFEKDELGVRVRPGEKTVRRYMARVAEMYEEGASVEEVAAYERRWFGWVRGGLGGILEEE